MQTTGAPLHTPWRNGKVLLPIDFLPDDQLLLWMARRAACEGSPVVRPPTIPVPIRFFVRRPTS